MLILRCDRIEVTADAGVLLHDGNEPLGAGSLGGLGDSRLHSLTTDDDKVVIVGGDIVVFL